MKKIYVFPLIFTLFLSTWSFTSCNNNKAEDTSTVAAAPVEIAGNDELNRGVRDATKDYPSVKADVSDSIIYLTGEIARADWQRLNPTLNSLHPKRVNSDSLTIK